MISSVCGPVASFLRAMCITLAGVLALGADDAPHHPTEEAWARLPPHPRLFATSAQWEALRGPLAGDPVASRLLTYVRAEAERLLAQPPVALRQRNRGKLSGSMLEPAREVQRRVLILAATARISGDLRFRDRAWVELRQLATLPDWNPAVFLDTAEATLAVAVGYDWLHDMLSLEDRDLLASAIITKGLRASFDSPAKMLSWVRGTNNWNQVCHGALVIGALAIAEREPELARRVVTRAVDHVGSSAKAYAPDGVYPEGPMYWSYGTSFHVAMLAALETALGDRCGLDSYPGFLRTADYLMQVTAPSGSVFNYADSSLQRSFEPALFWFARRLQQPLPARETNGFLSAAVRAPGKAPRLLPLALFWWDPATAERAARELPLHWHGGGHVPVAVHRSAWDDPRAAYIAVKGGRAQVSHGHMDAGSFVLEADGVRWAVDAGMQGYGTLYEAGIDSGLWRFTSDSPRWSVFRIGPEGHNILRFDGAPHRVEGAATITRFVDTGARPNTQLDLTALYADTKSVRRGIALLPDRRVLLQDEWETSSRATVASSQWLTYAEIEIQGASAVLKQKGQSLRLRVLEPANATLSVEDTARLLHAHDQPNPGLRRLIVQTPAPASRTGRLVVVAEPGSVKNPAAIELRPLAEW